MVAPRYLKLLALVALLHGCDDNGRVPPVVVSTKTLLEVATDEGLNQFITLAGQAGFTEAFQTTTSQLTLFAPTDAALNALPASVKSDPDELHRYMSFLIVGGRKTSKIVGASDQLLTVAGSYVTIDADGSTIRLLGADGSSARLTKMDLVATNGIIHVIDAFLVPTDPPGPGSFVDVATEAGLTTFAAAVTSAGLADDLSEDGAVFTVLAPTEDAFMDFNDGDLPANRDVLANILLTHVLVGEVATASLTAGGMFETAAKTIIEVPADKLGATDLATDNGVLNELTEVLTPPTIPAVIDTDEDLSEFADVIMAASPAVKAALDPDTLGDEDPITVFAPIDAAWTSTVPPTAAQLQHHVLPMQVTTSSLADGSMWTTLNGDEITVDVDAQGVVTIIDGSGNRAKVVEGDVRTLSGVIHLIDRVLEP